MTAVTTPSTAATERVRGELRQHLENGAIPPFVYSYPPRSTYRPLPDTVDIADAWSRDLDRSHSRDLNLYLHVPFCRYKCGFCNLYTVISEDEDLYDAYTDALCTQLLDHSDIIRSRRLRSIYIGGGTPSLLQERHFDRIFGTLTDVYPAWRRTAEEVAIEATPDSIAQQPGTLAHLMSLGLTRANIGIQSLVPAELKTAGRALAGDQVVRAAVAVCQELGLPNLSTDLIMGFAGQTDESWAFSVAELAALSPDTISTYFLTVRPDAWFSKLGAYQYAWNPDLYRRYDVAREIFLAAGYVQESNVRYKKPGTGGYVQKVLTFQGVPLLGLGVGARSYNSEMDYMVGSVRPSMTEVHDYIRKAREHRLVPETGTVHTREELLRKHLVLNLFDLDLAGLDQWGYDDFRDRFDPILEAAEQEGLIELLPGRRVQLTPLGMKHRDTLSWMFYSDRVVELDREYYASLHEQNARAVATKGLEVTVSGLARRS